MIDENKILTDKEFIWYRNAMGMSQQEMANKLGITKQTISNLELNKTKRNKKIYSICYQVIWEALYSEEEKKWRSRVADLGLNAARDESKKVIELIKNGKI